MKRLTAGKIGGHEISSGEVQRNRVLVVDDHQNVRNAITEVLREAGLEVESCGGGPQALLAAQGKVFQCVVSDLQMPGMDGIELMKEFSARKHPARFVMITAHASVCTAVEAMRLGAFDYIEKPCDLENLERLVFRAIRHSRSDAEPGDSPHLRNPSPAIGKNPQRNENGNGEPANSLSVPIMIGSSEVMRNLRKRIEQVAQHGETVLITGENGTGKEIVAKMIHALSPRRDHPWITLNCPALSPQLMESELFGHKKGAFTGAEQDRIGRFEAAGSGTILLDEITEIDLHLQPKLLRVLQERSFERVGSSETLPSHARVLATTNRDLSREIGGGRFREDL